MFTRLSLTALALFSTSLYPTAMSGKVIHAKSVPFKLGQNVEETHGLMRHLVSSDASVTRSNSVRAVHERAFLDLIKLHVCHQKFNSMQTALGQHC
jgi:hypothetical protein